MQGDDVAGCEQALAGDVPDAHAPALVIRVEVVGKDTTAEPRHDAGEHRADRACADDADRLAVQVEPQQAGEREVALTYARVGAVDPAVERQHEAGGVLGDGVRRVRRHAHHAHVEVGGGLQVDVVEAS
jgi:hypothetical protein